MKLAIARKVPPASVTFASASQAPGAALAGISTGKIEPARREARGEHGVHGDRRAAARPELEERVDDLVGANGEAGLEADVELLARADRSRGREPEGVADEREPRLVARDRERRRCEELRAVLPAHAVAAERQVQRDQERGLRALERRHVGDAASLVLDHDRRVAGGQAAPPERKCARTVVPGFTPRTGWPVTSVRTTPGTASTSKPAWATIPDAS